MGKTPILALGLLILATTTAAGAGTRTLTLVRHGAYDHEDPADPEVGMALVPLGVAQARLTANRLALLPAPVTALVTSPMTRARETARVIGEAFGDVAIQENRLLRECVPPTVREDVMAHWPEEHVTACREQFERAFAELFVPAPGEDLHEILVCHGNVIRYLVTRVLGMDPERYLDLGLAHCSLTVVRVTPDGSMKLLAFGDAGHLPPNLQSGLTADDPRLAVPE